MSNRFALPMYAIDPAASRAFWQVIKDLLARRQAAAGQGVTRLAEKEI